MVQFKDSAKSRERDADGRPTHHQKQFFATLPRMSASLLSSVIFVVLAFVLSFLLLDERRSQRTILLWAAFLVGAAFRLRYLQTTPLSAFAYDYLGHMNYLGYVLQHWSIPLSAEGWEFHQPPLYYFFGGFVIKATHFLFPLGGDETTMGVLSLVLSWISLALGLLCLERMFRGWPTPYLLLSSLSLALLPSVIFFASRVSNDSLFHALCFGWLWLLLEYRDGKDRRVLAALSTITALAILTKLTGLLLLVPLFGTVLFSAGPRFLQQRAVSIVLPVLLVLTLWYPVYRFKTETDTLRLTTFGNAYMNPEQQLPPFTAKEVLTFSPVGVMGMPFNDSFNNAYRRQNFWEFFYRSAFFGEFKFLSLTFVSSLILLTGMLLLPFFFFGIFLSRKHLERDLPLLLTLTALLFGVLAYRLAFPFPSNQDLRYVIVIFLPVLYFLCTGIRATKDRLQLFAVSCWSFLLLLFTVFLLGR